MVTREIESATRHPATLRQRMASPPLVVEMNGGLSACWPQAATKEIGFTFHVSSFTTEEVRRSARLFGDLEAGVGAVQRGQGALVIDFPAGAAQPFFGALLGLAGP